jgi:hypothetical protein
MLSCKETVTMLAGDAGLPMSLADRVSLVLHLAMCRYCRAYARSVRALGVTARRLFGGAPADAERARATLEAVRQAARRSEAN